MPDKVILFEDSRSDQDLVVFGDAGAVFVTKQLPQCPMWNPAHPVIGVKMVNKSRGVGNELVATTMSVDQLNDLARQRRFEGFQTAYTKVSRRRRRSNR